MKKDRSTSVYKKRRKFPDELIYDTIMEHVQAGAEKGVRPEDIAMSLYKEEWQSLLKRIRIFARKLAHEGYVHILRKGKPADPDDFRGVYRIGSGERVAEYVKRMPEE